MGKDLGTKFNIGDAVHKFAKQNSKKELVEHYKSKINYASKIFEEGVKLSKGEWRELASDLYNANILLGKKYILKNRNN